MFFGYTHKSLFEAHLVECREDRLRTAAAFEAFAKAVDKLSDTIELRHQENRRSIAGIYTLLWATVGSIVVGLFTVIGFLLSKTVVHI